MYRTNFIFLIIYFAHEVCILRADYGSEIFPSLKSYRFNWFKRQIDGSTRRPTSTDICDEKEFKEFTFDQNKCQRSAFFTFLLKYDFRASDLENEKTTCNKYLAQVKCFDEGGPKKLKCWNELTKETKKTQFLFKKYQKLTLFGSSIVNGKKFVNTCSAFENFEENYLRMETGCSTCCTLSEFDQKWRKKERCLNRALSKTKRQRKIGLKKKGEDGRYVKTVEFLSFLIQTKRI